MTLPLTLVAVTNKYNLVRSVFVVSIVLIYQFPCVKKVLRTIHIPCWVCTKRHKISVQLTCRTVYVPKLLKRSRISSCSCLQTEPSARLLDDHTGPKQPRSLGWLIQRTELGLLEMMLPAKEIIDLQGWERLHRKGSTNFFYIIFSLPVLYRAFCDDNQHHVPINTSDQYQKISCELVLRPIQCRICSTNRSRFRSLHQHVNLIAPWSDMS